MRTLNRATTIKALALAAPIVMAAVGYFLGNVQPLVYDICDALLAPGTLITERPATTVVGDAGAP